ncbi:TetR/AcrR family transcriptional regulator [Marinobacter nanhaiticus D15-8W]|uniref:TetR/AcrR family transcriptional regulator n=1 Tax=Marinobacter nanhaiticus D15-8W TaxID=626887 RepID=N6WV79_9GAMM|nr:TetR/AcrR family transcriptional regulator [Marinobacter nanhaiticus]ENO14942.1 TetR/AcrR family transcriptional regulator [Marinobacter nanhaiticus D15-8W]BES69362.1 TetR/AcrR family transcriptional regulator [Marinobacter nanhaiticus D15-8W]
MSATPEKRRSGRPRSEASREAALRAASELLDEQGYAGLSIEGIAARAGIGKRTIYRWWPTKGAVVMEAFLADISPRITFPTTDCPIADIKSQLRSVVTAYRGKDGRTVREIVALGRADMATMEAFVSDYLEPRREAAKKALIRIMDESVAEGADLDTIVDGLYGPIFFRLLVQHAPLDESFIERHVVIYLAGLRSEGLLNASVSEA